MKKDDFIKLGVTDDDLAKKLETASAEELKGFIPKSRFDEVSNEKKKLETDIQERNEQLEVLKNSTDDIKGLRKQIETLQNENKAKDEAHAAEIKQLKTNSAVEAALVAAKARNITAVKALLKLDKAELGDDGSIKGLSEQIAVLQKSDGYLFDNSKPVLKGAVPGETGNEDGDKKVDVSKMTYSEMAAYMAEHPDAKID